MNHFKYLGRFCPTCDNVKITDCFFDDPLIEIEVPQKEWHVIASDNGDDMAMICLHTDNFTANDTSEIFKREYFRSFVHVMSVPYSTNEFISNYINNKLDENARRSDMNYELHECKQFCYVSVPQGWCEGVIRLYRNQNDDITAIEIKFGDEKEEENKSDKSESEDEKSEPKEEKKSDSDEEIKEEKPRERYFKLINNQTGAVSGRFSGVTPKQAATKALTKLVKQTKKKDSDSEKEESKESDHEEVKERYFKLIIDGRACGRYTGDTPKQAASKAFTKVLQNARQQGGDIPNEMTIYLKESTRGCDKKIYGYRCSRVKLDQPQSLVITDNDTGQQKTITYEYRNRVCKISRNEIPEDLLSPPEED